MSLLPMGGNWSANLPFGAHSVLVGYQRAQSVSRLVGQTECNQCANLGARKNQILMVVTLMEVNSCGHEKTAGREVGNRRPIWPNFKSRASLRAVKRP